MQNVKSSWRHPFTTLLVGMLLIATLIVPAKPVNAHGWNYQVAFRVAGTSYKLNNLRIAGINQNEKTAYWQWYAQHANEFSTTKAIPGWWWNSGHTLGIFGRVTYGVDAWTAIDFSCHFYGFSWTSTEWITIYLDPSTRTCRAWRGYFV